MLVRALGPFLLVGCCACQRDNGAPPPIEADAAGHRVREVLGPPVRAYPPHAIRSDGVGPYLLDQPLADVLRKLPEGPNLEVLQLGKYASWLVVSAENGQILVGADVKGPVRFIAVVAPEVARTAAGVGVGASGDKLLDALGPPRRRGVSDRLVWEMASLPGVRFISDAPAGTPPDKAHVEAVLVTKPADEPPRRACADVSLPAADAVAAARAKGEGAPAVRFGCFTSAAPEALVVQGGEAILVGGDPTRLRRLAVAAVAPEAVVGPLDVDGDGRDDIVAIETRRGERELAVAVRVLRWDGARLVELVSARPFVIGEAMASAVGTTPAQVELPVEVTPVAGGIAVAGVYLATGAHGPRHVAPLEPVIVRFEARKPGAAVPDAGERP
jgi:hypothetical protein